MEVWISVCRSFLRDDFTETIEVFATKEEAVEFNNEGIDKLMEYWEQIGPVHGVREEKIKVGEVVSDIDRDEGYACFYKQGYYYEDCDECFVQKKIVKMRNWIEFNDIDGNALVIDRDDITHMRSDGQIGVISCSLPEGDIKFRVLPEEFGRVKGELIK